MKTINKILIVMQFALSAVFFQDLPKKLPTHWNIQGHADSFVDKSFAVWMMPGLTVLILILFHYLPNWDPYKKNYKKFKKEWEIIKTLLVTFFAYFHFVTIYISLNPQKSILPFLFAGLGVLFVSLGNYLSKIRQNWFLGIRTPWTLSDEDNWNKTHRYASWTFVLAGTVTLFLGIFGIFSPEIIFVIIMTAAILPILYSFLLFKKSEDKMKYVYGVVLLLLLYFLY